MAQLDSIFADALRPFMPGEAVYYPAPTVSTLPAASAEASDRDPNDRSELAILVRSATATVKNVAMAAYYLGQRDGMQIARGLLSEKYEKAKEAFEQAAKTGGAA